ncbi:unnamed protein product [Phytophthora lilii]|uniref:Unnamed protein product n=1 Tax=Phytophthora lilii TaxID=2077276 RepID=A0A9W6WP65_9STRA|nr:unnamed protein product [Phytophthora lilii]
MNTPTAVLPAPFKLGSERAPWAFMSPKWRGRRKRLGSAQGQGAGDGDANGNGQGNANGNSQGNGNGNANDNANENDTVAQCSAKLCMQPCRPIEAKDWQLNV